VFWSFVPTESSEVSFGSSSLASEEVAASVSRGSDDPTSDFSVSAASDESEGSDEFGAASAESQGPEIIRFRNYFGPETIEVWSNCSGLKRGAVVEWSKVLPGLGTF